MYKTQKYFNFSILSLLIIFGAACSSGGGGGEAESVPLPFLAKTTTSSPIKNLTVSLAQSVSHSPKLVIQDISDDVCLDGGSAIADVDENKATATLSACINDSTTANGIIKFSSSTSGDTTTFIFEFKDFTITTPGGTETINAKATCRQTGSTIFCEFDSEAPGIDGRVYEVSGISVAFDPASGYSVGCLVDDPDHGDIIVSTNIPITLNCPNDQPSSGEIVITDGDGKTATITFIDCDSYSVSFNGSTTTFMWP